MYTEVRNDPKLCILAKCGAGELDVISDNEKEEPKGTSSDVEMPDAEE